LHIEPDCAIIIANFKQSLSGKTGTCPLPPASVHLLLFHCHY